MNTNLSNLIVAAILGIAVAAVGTVASADECKVLVHQHASCET